MCEICREKPADFINHYEEHLDPPRSVNVCRGCHSSIPAHHQPGNPIAYAVYKYNIIDGIFKVLNDGDRHNADEIARLVGCSWRGVIHWLDIINRIQGMPRVERARVGRVNIYWIPFEETRRRK